MSHRPRVNICFHGVGEPTRRRDPGEEQYWIDESTFCDILDMAAGQPTVGLSFDDGNASDVVIALPALRERGLRAAFFPIAGRIGSQGSVDAGGLQRLLDAGMTVGSHGMHHRPWRGLAPDELDVELIDAREIIAASTGVVVTAAACPLGSYDRRVLARLKSLGYAEVFTSDRAPARRGAWLQSRYSVRGTDSIAAIRSFMDQRPSLSQRALMGARLTLKRFR